MQNILVVQSSVLGDASASRGLINDFLTTLGTRANVTTRDVGTNPLPHLSGTTLGGFSGADGPEATAERALSDELIAELQAADVLVIGAPMYNFGITSNLKSWFDRVLRAGVTFHYTAEGPVGYLSGKRVIVVETRGGFYSEGDGKALDAQEPHIRAFNTRITWDPGVAFSAFGFDFDSAGETWDVLLGLSMIASLDPRTNGFFGITSPDSLDDFSLRSTSQNQGGISVDNMAFGIPEPGSMFLAAGGLAALLLRRRK